MIDVYYSRIACNTYVLFNEKNEGILVDPGYNKNNLLLEHLSNINKNIEAILITHAHYDHIYALKEVLEVYPKAKVYISSEEVKILINSKLNLSAFDEKENLPPIEYRPNNLIEVNDGDYINECGFNLKVIATPFHTIGSVCFYEPNEKALFSGDTLFFTTIGRTDLPTGSNKTIESSLKKLKELPDGIKVYPGHGACTNLDREKKYNSYLKNI